ncbi:MAG: ABC transporter permease [Candidatus Krumholzibacteriota bacterium]|nr:ABC transporter permease [Candidatus Krumholzibacteriota bacterium]
MKRVGVLVLYSVQETLRDRLLLGLLAAGAILLLLVGLLAPMTLGAREKTFHDLGLAWIHLSGVLILLVLGAWTLHRERERGIWLTILTRPVTRAEYVLGRLLGLLCTLALALLGSALVYSLVGWITGLGPTAGLGISLAYNFLEMSILAGLILLFSTFSGFALTVFLAMAVFFAGHLSADLLRLAALTDNSLARSLATAFHWLLPHLELFRVRNALVAGTAPAPLEALRDLGYALAYLGALAGIAITVFLRREIR